MSDTGPARLPGLPKLQSTDNQLALWAERVNEHLEVRSGARGNDLERSATQRDIKMLLAKIAALEKQLTGTTTIAVEEPVATKTEVAPAKQKSYDTEVSELRTKNDALTRRVMLLESRVSIGGSGYSAGFIKETDDLAARPNPWAINGTVRWGQSTFEHMFRELRWGLLETGPNTEMAPNNPGVAKLNGYMLISGIKGASDGATTLRGFADRTTDDIAALSNRFDGAGRLQPNYMPMYDVKLYAGGGFQTPYQNALELIEGVLRQNGMI